MLFSEESEDVQRMYQKRPFSWLLEILLIGRNLNLRTGEKISIFRTGADEKWEVREQPFSSIEGSGIAVLFSRNWFMLEDELLPFFQEMNTRLQ
jgi:hypothetical protein